MLLPPLTCCVLVHKHFEIQNLLTLYNLANWLQLSMHFAFVAIDKIDFGHLSAFSVKLFSFRKMTEKDNFLYGKMHVNTCTCISKFN